MMLALCVEIQKFQPEARFTIIARRNAGLIGDMAAQYPFIKVVAIHRKFAGLGAFVWHAFSKPYLVLMPAAFGKSAVFNTKYLFLLLRLRPGTHTFGLLKSTEDNPYQKSIAYDPGIQHFDNMRRLARLAGLTVAKEGELIDFSFKKLDSFVPPYPKGAYIVFHPFGSSSSKSFPPRRSKELLALLADTYPHYPVVITGGKENEAEAKEISAGIAHTTLALNLPILELAALMGNSALYIGVDTGPTHVASMLKVPSVILTHNMGPSWMPRYNPNAIILTNDTRCVCDGNKGGECVVYEDGKPYLRCLYDITDDQILQATEHFLSHAKA